MEPIELIARREALGLSQIKLAEAVGWKHTRISECEAGKRAIPDWIDAKLVELEDQADALADTLLDAALSQPAQVVVIPSYVDDQQFWSDWPDCDGLPACVHRAAAAEALKGAREEGVSARIVDAGPSIDS